MKCETDSILLISSAFWRHHHPLPISDQLTTDVLQASMSHLTVQLAGSGQPRSTTGAGDLRMTSGRLPEEGSFHFHRFTSYVVQSAFVTLHSGPPRQHRYCCFWCFVGKWIVLLQPEFILLVLSRTAHSPAIGLRRRVYRHSNTGPLVIGPSCQGSSWL